MRRVSRSVYGTGSRAGVSRWVTKGAFKALSMERRSDEGHGNLR